MRLRAEQLGAHLGKTLSPVYLVTGDEPLLWDEAAAEIRAALRRAGVEERQAFQADSGFDWGAWLAGFASLSLFASRRLVELRLPGGKPGVEGAKALERWCTAPPPDTWLVLQLPRADRAMQGSKWFAALERSGVWVVATPPDVEHLPEWIGRRLARHGLKADRETLAFLAQRVEGNLLAAHQEIEKLALLLPPGDVSRQQAEEAVLDVARYDASQIPDALLKGETIRLSSILQGLRAEGETPILALWILTQEIRTLYRLAAQLRHGESLSRAMQHVKVWESRQALLSRALKRLSLETLRRALLQAAYIDRAAKGLAREDAWELLQRLALALAGTPGPKTYEEVHGH